MITLTQSDLQQFDKLLAEIPFKHAYPIFKLLRDKVNQEIAKQNTKDNGGQSDAPKDTTTAS